MGGRTDTVVISTETPPLPKAEPSRRRRGAKGERVEHVCAGCARKGGGSVQRVLGNPCAGAGPRGLRFRPLLWRGRLRGLELSTPETNSARKVAKPSPSFDELGVAMCRWHDLNVDSLPLSLHQRLSGPGHGMNSNCYVLVR